MAAAAHRDSGGRAVKGAAAAPLADVEAAETTGADASSTSVVICAYTDQRWDDLVAAVQSVRDQTIAALETIVVVDHNDELFKRAQRELADVLVVRNQETRGLSGARNSGIATARGDVIAFLDDDAVADTDWIARMSERYRTPEVVGVGGTVEPLWTRGRPRAFPEEFQWVVGCTYRGVPRTVSPVRNVIGANMSFRRSVFDELGGFKSGIGRVGTRPVGCEETEICIRVRQRRPGAVILFDPEVRVGHRVPPARAGWRYFRSRCYAEGLSKAIVSRTAGAADGLETERGYATRTLPRAVARGVVATVRHHDGTGVIRAAAVIAGLSVTSFGYLVGSLSRASAEGAL